MFSYRKSGWPKKQECGKHTFRPWPRNARRAFQVQHLAICAYAFVRSSKRRGSAVLKSSTPRRRPRIRFEFRRLVFYSNFLKIVSRRRCFHKALWRLLKPGRGRRFESDRRSSSTAGSRTASNAQYRVS